MKTRRFALLLCAMCLGCSKAAPPPAPAAKTGTPGTPQTTLKRVITRTAVENDLRQLATLYMDYNGTFGKSPGSLEEFKPSIERDARKLLQQIQDGYFIVVWKVNSFSSNTLLAYEKDADGDGFRYAVMGDSSVKKMNEEEWHAAAGK